MDLKKIISRQDYVLNKETAYLLGVYLSDGFITETSFQLQAIDKDFVERTLECLRKINPKTKAYLRIRNDQEGWNKSPRYVIKVGLGDQARWIKNITNNKHHVPFNIWNANDGLKRWFIAGIMDGDGWISKTKRQNGPQYQYRIGIGGVEDGWIYEFRELLNSFHVKCNKIERFQTKYGRWFCRFSVRPQTFFDAKLFFTIKRKKDRCIIASQTTR